ncbi:MAG: hypothetical protein AAF393_08115 [Pseudomonadota bacterium]
MSLIRKICLGYFVILALVATLNYIPGLTDAEGRTFGIFALDIFDDSLHAVSALWALAAALVSHRASWIFLTYFGAAYFIDGLIGVYAGSGILDFGIFTYGILDQSLIFNILASLPHLALGGFALMAVWVWGNRT